MGTNQMAEVRRKLVERFKSSASTVNHEAQQATTRKTIGRLTARLVGRKGFVRDASILAGGNAVAQALPILATPVLTRLYAPTELGALALFVSFVTAYSSVAALGFNKAIVSAPGDSEAEQLLVLSLATALPMSILGFVTHLLLVRNDWLGYGSIPFVNSLATFVAIALTSVYGAFRFFVIRDGLFEIVARTTIVQGVSRAGGQVILAPVLPGAAGLIAGEMLGRGLGVRRLILVAQHRVVAGLKALNLSHTLTLVARYRKFPLIATPSTLINSLALALPPAMVASTFDVASAGQFSVATRLLLLPLVMVGRSVGDVYHNRLAKLSREEPSRVGRFFTVVAVALFLIGVWPMLAIQLFGSSLVPLVLGERWQVAGAISEAVAPWALAQFVVNPLARTVHVYQGQELKLIFDVLSLGSIMVVFGFAPVLDWSLIEACRVLSWFQATAYFVLLLLLRMLVRRTKPVY